MRAPPMNSLLIRAFDQSKGFTLISLFLYICIEINECQAKNFESIEKVFKSIFRLVRWIEKV